MFRVLRNFAVGAMILVSAVTVSAANEPAKPADMLFEGKHLKLTKPNSELMYRFQRSSSTEAILGSSFSDDIKLAIDKVKDDDKRDFALQIFTGERARDPFLDHDRAGNPLLLWYLDRTVNSYKALSGGTLTYVKGRFIEAVQGDKNLVKEPIKVDINGQSVDALRLTITPYVNDPNASRMRGYEGSRFVVVVSDAVPGYFVEMTSIFESTTPKSPRLEERINFVSEGAKK